MTVGRATVLPTYTTPLIGREAEVQAILTQLADPALRLLSLVGPSGTGKTRLALHVAQVVAEQFPDGVRLLSLSGITDPALLLPTLAAGLDIREKNARSLLSTLATVLQNQRCLLVLDALEPDQAIAEQLSLFLEHVSSVVLLVTTPLTLDLPHEHVLEVPPLPTPDSAPMSSIGLMQDIPAVRLFIERMQAVQPQFMLSQDNALAVAEICQRLQGMPLALELVATHSGALQPGDLLVLLRNHLSMALYTERIKGMGSSVLQPVLSWCTAMLPPDTRNLLLRLSVFPDSWTEDVIGPVCYGEPTTSPVLRERFGVLLTKHLVLETVLPDGSFRYSMLDAVRQFAALMLRHQRLDTSLEQMHANTYRLLAQKVAAQAEQTASINHVLIEQPNFRAALHWALEEQAAATAAEISGKLWRIWLRAGMISEGRFWLEHTLALSEPVLPELRQLVLHGAGSLALAQGDSTAAIHWLEQSLELGRQAADVIAQIRTAHNLATLLRDVGQLEQASIYASEAVGLCRQAEQLSLLGTCLSTQATIYWYQGDNATAIQLLDESLEQRRAQHDVLGVATTQGQLGAIFLLMRELDKAAPLISASLEQFQALRHPLGTIGCQINQGLLDICRRQSAAAQRNLWESLERSRALDYTPGLIASIEAWGQLAALEQQPLTAVHLLAQASALRQQSLLPVPPPEQAWLSQVEAALKADLGAAAFQTAWDAGLVLSFEASLKLLPGNATAEWPTLQQGFID